eukprot:5909056-Amphidinium_carterae.1
MNGCVGVMSITGPPPLGSVAACAASHNCRYSRSDFAGAQDVLRASSWRLVISTRRILFVVHHRCDFSSWHEDRELVRVEQAVEHLRHEHPIDMFDPVVEHYVHGGISFHEVVESMLAPVMLFLRIVSMCPVRGSPSSCSGSPDGFSAKVASGMV